MATRVPDIYIPTAYNVSPVAVMGSTVYEIVMSSASGVILLVTGIAMLGVILRKCWKKHRLLEVPSTRAEVMATHSHELKSCNGISPPDPFSQPDISCICEVVGNIWREKREHRDTSLSRPVECFVNDTHITIQQT